MRKALVIVAAATLVVAGNIAFAGEKSGGSHSDGNQSAHSNSNQRPQHIEQSSAPHVEQSATPHVDQSATPKTSESAAPKPQPSETINTRQQLAIADAKANLDQALAAAGTDKAAKKAARDAYKLQVKQIKKALGVK